MDADVNVYGKEIIRIQIGNKYELNRQYILNIFYQRSKNAVPCVLFEHCIYRLIGSEYLPNFFLTILFQSSVQYVNPLVTHYFEQRMARSIAVCVNFFPKKIFNFAHISRFKFIDCLFYFITILPLSLSATFHISNLQCLLRLSYRLLFSCIQNPSSLC